MKNPWIAIAQDATRLSLEAQRVIALRLGRLARGGKRGRAEAHKMVAEKAEALVQAQVAAAKSVMSGEQAPTIARKTLDIYGKRVRRNRRRLSPWWMWW
jgi:hypothetical protein